MATALPTVKVPDAQAADILSAFGGEDAYKAWLVQSILDRVLQFEAVVAQEEATAKVRDRLNARRDKFQNILGLAPAPAPVTPPPAP